MLASAGISGTIGRAFLLVGFIGAIFGAFAAVAGARRNDQQIIRLIPRFATLIFAAAVGAFAAMEYAMITRDFSLAYVQKWDRGRRRRFITSPQCGAHLKVQF